VLDHLTETQRRAYIIADNRLSELAGWDEKMLAAELADLERVIEASQIPAQLSETEELVSGSKVLAGQ